MEICNPCTETNLLPSCLDILTVGKTALGNTDYYVYLQNITTGAYPIRFEVTSDEDGYLDVDFSNFEPMPDHSYKVWATLTSAKNLECTEAIYPASCDYPYISDTYDCFALRFSYVDDTDLMKVYYTTASITVAE